MATASRRGEAMRLLTERFTRHDDYLAWVDGRPDEEWYEVVDGLPVMSPSPGLAHQRCLGAVFRLLDAACPADFEVILTPFDWVLWEHPRLQVRQPDVVVTRRIEDTAARALVETPLLAAEVLSPSSVERDAVTKRREYAHAGLPHYWLVDPETPQVAIHRLQAGALELVIHATGDALVELAEPFPVLFRPTELLT